MPATTKDNVVSVRIESHVLEQSDELAVEMDRSRSHLIAQAVHEFIEREYASMCVIREGERELAAGKGSPHDRVSAWVEDLICGKGRPKAFR